jgi:hypothetical protein
VTCWVQRHAWAAWVERVEPSRPRIRAVIPQVRLVRLVLDVSGSAAPAATSDQMQMRRVLIGADIYPTRLTSTRLDRGR